MESDRGASKAAAAQRLLTSTDTAVIEDVATLLVMEQSAESMALVCEALASQRATVDPEVQEAILWVLSPAWKSGKVDVPTLLREVQASGTEEARTGAGIALDWLKIGA